MHYICDFPCDERCFVGARLCMGGCRLHTPAPLLVPRREWWSWGRVGGLGYAMPPVLISRDCCLCLGASGGRVGRL